MKARAIPVTPCLPSLDEFDIMIRNTVLVESVREIRRSALRYAEQDPAWIPHLESVEAFMRECGVSFNVV